LTDDYFPLGIRELDFIIVAVSVAQFGTEEVSNVSEETEASIMGKSV